MRSRGESLSRLRSTLIAEFMRRHAARGATWGLSWDSPRAVAAAFRTRCHTVRARRTFIAQVTEELRRKIERDPQDPELLLTVWGVGYKFADVNPSHD
jgi:hypothetical protein